MSILAAAGSAVPAAVPTSAVDPAFLPLLHEAREALGSTSASLLLVNEAGTVLEPAASVGLRQTIRAASRVPMGHGFAGRIALSRQPLSIHDLSAENVLNPVLRANDIHSLLGVPVLSGHRLVGVLHVGTVEAREFGEEDVVTLLDLAGRIAESAASIGSDRAHDAALVLQRSLLPSTQRRVAGLEVGARYVPAEGDLGGDWYDVFELPDGAVGLVMGDVVGHGLPAAVVMGRLRSALRAYALDHASPAVVLERLDRKIGHFEDGAFATCVYGVTYPPFDTITISTAGHWPPLAVAPTQEPRPVELLHDPMLGIGAFERRAVEVRLDPGTSLCFFTDGLIERPHPRAGSDLPAPEDWMELVGRTLQSDDDPETTCSRIISEVVGDAAIEDDIALLVVRRP